MRFRLPLKLWVSVILTLTTISAAGCTGRLPSRHFSEEDLRAPSADDRHNYLFVAIDSPLTEVEVHMPRVWGRRYCWDLKTGDQGGIAFARQNHGRIHAEPFHLRIYQYTPDALPDQRAPRVFDFSFDHLFNIPPAAVGAGGKLFYIKIELGPGPQNLLIARGWEDLRHPSSRMPKFKGPEAATQIEIFGKTFILSEPVVSRFIIP